MVKIGPFVYSLIRSFYSFIMGEGIMREGNYLKTLFQGEKYLD
jgi:hypothetical protein